MSLNDFHVSNPRITDLIFYCQLAHGSQTCILHGFSTLRELYLKIADCFDLDPIQIMYCTVNTPRLDMLKILHDSLTVDDFLFAHLKGQPKEISLVKQVGSFGLTLGETGLGVVYIKRLHPEGLIARLSSACGSDLVKVGDQIEAVDSVSFVDSRHFQVATYLQRIPIGQSFVLRLVSPEQSSSSS